MADYENASGADFWGDIGAGILPYCKSTKRFLLNLRSSEVNEPNTYGVWGGKLDEGETDPKKAAIRELEEESKFSDNIELKELCIFKTKGFKYFNYIGYLDDEFTPDVSDCWESDGYKWVELEELINMDNLHFGVEFILSECYNDLKGIINESILFNYKQFINRKEN